MKSRRIPGVPRYCGRMKILVKLVPAYGGASTRERRAHRGGAFGHEEYRCLIYVNGERVSSQRVGIPPGYQNAIDSPEAYDEVASAALAFAADSGEVDDSDCEFDERGDRRIRRVRPQ